FCGDTLFACGCGRLFEGTAEQMFASLSKLAALPDDTKVYCGHEYTLANIGFAKAVEPQNAALSAREARDRKLREAGRPTLPSTLRDEKATNPFLRCREPAVVESANKYLGARVADPVRVFAAIRDWKNKFGDSSSFSSPSPQLLLRPAAPRRRAVSRRRRTTRPSRSRRSSNAARDPP